MRTTHQPKGFIAMVTLLGISSFALSVVVVVTTVFLSELQMTRGAGIIDDTYYAAESGLHEGLYRLIKNPIETTHHLTLGNQSVTVNVGANPLNPYQRTITAQAIDQFNHTRTVEIIADTSSLAGGFDYAIQSTGDIKMEGGSKIVGDAYSNSAIIFQSGSNATITSHAYYQTIDSKILVNGSTCPNAYCHPNAQPKELPLTDAEVTVWKNEISTTLALNCRQASDSGPNDTYCISGNQTLGIQKIDGGVHLENNAILTLSGNIWITGNITFGNNITVVLDSSLGPSSAVIITDGIVDVGNNVMVCPTTPAPTCNAQGFVIILSTNPSTSDTAPAIYAANNSSSIIFAAINGALRVKQNGALNAAASKNLHLEQNSTVTYNPLLAAFVVGTGGGGQPIGTALGSWHEK